MKRKKICIKERFKIRHEEFYFEIPVRLKWDLWAVPRLGLTADIKSTTATTYKQFVAACNYFEYWRQRAWYMDIDGCDKDMLIGISKVNYQIFKVPITRGDENYMIGKRQYQELAWQHCYLFGDTSRVINLNLLPEGKMVA